MSDTMVSAQRPTALLARRRGLLSLRASADLAQTDHEMQDSSRYQVIGCLGQGGMGVVYEVFDKQRSERVALKKLLHYDAVGLYRFKNEFRTLADVLHPNLVHLHELVAEGDDVFFTMELVVGTDFLGYVCRQGEQAGGVASRLRATADTRVHALRHVAGEHSNAKRSSFPTSGRSPADFDKLRHSVRQLVEGVRALHGSGKLHRDLKPSNVRVTPEGRVVILDFGVATELGSHRAAAEEVVGTVTYMAPEQALGETPLAASDWYSVGAILYEALVGRPPFTGGALDVLTLKATSAPARPSHFLQDIPEDLDALAVALLAPDPENRPAGADILRRLGTTPSDRAPSARSSDGPETTRFVGREAQLRALQDAFEATLQGLSIAVRVSGLSGFGKTAVAHHFFDQLEKQSDVLVLRGRAYERESVPYKAVDSVIDALTRHLLEREDSAGFELPEEIASLAHIFPVLRRVPTIDDIPRAPAGDPQVVRQRAFGALREIFASLSQRQRVAIFIDDVQWGDSDSAALLVELVRQPAAPPLLLVMTHRTEDSAGSAFLADVRARWPEDAEMREIAIGPLEEADAKRLALAFMGSEDKLAQKTAEGIASEARGSPFLLEELARSASVYHQLALAGAPSAIGSLTLDQLLGERAAILPDDARRLLELVVVGGRPLPVETVAAAANIGDAAIQVVALLRARRFVRAGLRNGIEIVEPIHDRIREVIVAQLPDEVARDHHAQLARVLEASPDSDPEAIASHLLGAGDNVRAAHYAERAAEQAIEKLAFAQAARLFRLTIETLPGASPDTHRLQRRLAEASEWAGLGESAARAYLSAAQGASPLERIDLERAAAAQLMAAGRFDEGALIFRRVLAAVGRAVPGSILGTLFWVVYYRLVSRVLGRAKTVESKGMPFEAEVRLGALYAASRGLALIDPISAMYVKARHLVDALRLGSRAHIVRAAANEASTLASGGKREGKRERALFEMARRLSEESGDAEGYALYQITYGIGQYLRGRWKPCREMLDVACGKMAAVRRWNANANVYAVYALVNLGELREVKIRTMRLIADAEQRGDLYTAVNLRASHPIAAWLAANDEDGARRHLREAMAQWSKTRFLVQHWQAMLWEAEVDLYAGDGARAWDRLMRDAKPLKQSLLLSVQLMRALTHYVRGRAAIASIATAPVVDRAGRLAHAARAAKALDRESMVWTAPLGAIVAAGVAQATGDSAGAGYSLRRAIGLAQAAEMPLHAASASLQLGVLLGGDRGATTAHEAEESMRSRGVHLPHRYARMLVPGAWAADRTPRP